MSTKKELTIQVPVDQLKVGLYVDVGLSWMQNPFLFRRFRIKSTQEIKVIQDIVKGNISVYPGRSIVGVAPDAAEDAAAKDDMKPGSYEQALRVQKEKHLNEARRYRDQRQALMRLYRETSQKIKAFTGGLTREPANAIRDADGIVGDMLDNFEQKGHVLMNLINLPESVYTPYAHSLNVMVLSLSLARTHGLTGGSLRQVALGALLHDVGLIQVPPKITKSTTALSPAEQKVYETHPTIGGKLVRQIGVIDERVIDIIEMHHEMLDGSGYPGGIDEKKISLAVRIVSIANSYDNLCNPRESEKSLTPKQAMAILYSRYPGRLDQVLLENFVKTMGIYPPGTVVQLSDDSVALVVSVDTENLLKPVVLIYNPDIPKDEAFLMDLADRNDLTIEDALKPSQYPPEMYEYLGMTHHVGYFYSVDE